MVGADGAEHRDIGATCCVLGGGTCVPQNHKGLHLQIQDPEQNDSIALTLQHAAPRKGQVQVQQIKTSGAWSCLGPRQTCGSEPGIRMEVWS